MSQQRVTLYNCERPVRARSSTTGEVVEGSLAAVLRHISRDIEVESTWVLTYLPEADQ